MGAPCTSKVKCPVCHSPIAFAQFEHDGEEAQERGQTAEAERRDEEEEEEGAGHSVPRDVEEEGRPYQAYRRFYRALIKAVRERKL